MLLLFKKNIFKIKKILKLNEMFLFKNIKKLPENTVQQMEIFINLNCL